jgi:hypothetical protein
VAVYEGVLEELSGGSSIHGSPATHDMTSSEKISAIATQGANMTHREFIVIGGQRIMDVQLSNRHDALLVSSLGQHVRISAFKRGKGITVMGVRLADGTVDKMGVWFTVFVQSAAIALPVGFLVIVGLIGIFINAPIVALIAFGLAALFVRMVVMGARQMSAARSEL